MLDSRLVEVAFQTRRLGWETDDLLLIGEVAPGVLRKLAVQAKRTFTVAQSNEECRKTFRAMWHDFRASDRFNPDLDRLAIATLHGTTALLGHFQALLATAGAAASVEDFQARVRTNGVVSKVARNQYETVQAILQATEGQDVTDELLWRFLKSLVVLSLDLGTAASHTEASVLSLLALTAVGAGDARLIARTSWLALLDEAGARMHPSAGWWCIGADAPPPAAYRPCLLAMALRRAVHTHFLSVLARSPYVDPSIQAEHLSEEGQRPSEPPRECIGDRA